MEKPKVTMIDADIEAEILAYETGRDTAADGTPLREPVISANDAAAEVHTDIVRALQEGVI